jgi:outer membrane lipoprotein-sorting protein
VRPFFVGIALLAFAWAATRLAAPLEKATTASGIAAAAHPSVEGMTGERIFSNVLEHNRRREMHLQQYSATRTYLVKNDKDKVRAEAQVLLRYHAPASKAFEMVSERGSGFIRGRVFKPLLESEVETAAGRNQHDSSITPANYTFKLLGEEDIDEYHCFVVRATPKRHDKYLFEGKIWIHATEFAIVKIAGRPAKNPSFWIKRVDFVRRYQKIGDFWLPLRDESVSHVKILGKHTLTIDYDNYEIVHATGMSL